MLTLSWLKTNRIEYLHTVLWQQKKMPFLSKLLWFRFNDIKLIKMHFTNIFLLIGNKSKILYSISFYDTACYQILEILLIMFVLYACNKSNTYQIQTYYSYCPLHYYLFSSISSNNKYWQHGYKSQIPCQ